MHSSRAKRIMSLLPVENNNQNEGDKEDIKLMHGSLEQECVADLSTSTENYNTENGENKPKKGIDSAPKVIVLSNLLINNTEISRANKNDCLEDNSSKDFQFCAIPSTSKESSNVRNDIDDDSATGFSDDSLQDKNYVPESESESDSDLEQENITMKDYSEETINQATAEPAQRPRKKRLKKASERIARDKERHQMKSPCTCQSKCINKITENRRIKIWTEFYQNDHNRRQAWLHSRIIQKDKKRKITKAEVSKRTKSLVYNFPNEKGQLQEVCKTFFLKTLGCHAKNDRMITTMLKNSTGAALTPQLDRRGSAPANKCDRNLLREHIQSFNPCISHYRREHAPNRLYLPSDITAKSMHLDYNYKNPNNKVSYQTYRKVLTEMNISFTKLGNEECDTCVQHIHHVKLHESETGMELEHEVGVKQLKENDDPNRTLALNTKTINASSLELPNTSTLNYVSLTESSLKYQEACVQCKKYLEHSEKAKISRIEYRKDLSKEKFTTKSVRSVDLQKVIMLPRIPGSKKTCFTKRIVVFHQTFATMEDKGSKSNEKHEAIAGRKAEEIASAFHKALLEERDVAHILYWCDNCSAQNKNWCLFTMLVTMVNSNLIKANDITVKFFEAGHTFMSADSVHHGVELSMKNMSGGNIYDYQDFVTAVENSNGRKMNVINMKNEDFLKWVSGDSKTRKNKNKPYLCDISVVQFRRGSRSMFYKNNMTEDDFTEFNFLKVNFRLDIPQKLRSNARGVPPDKKKDIISNLCPLMPENRRAFWLQLQETDGVDDLIDNE